MENFISGVSKTTLKAVSSGAVASIASKYILGIDAQVPIPFLNTNINSMLAYGLVVGGASAINEATKDFTLPLLGLDKGIVSTGQMIAGPALTGFATVGLSYIVNGMELPSTKGAVNGFLLGAGSDMAGSYVSSMWDNLN